MKLAHRLLIGAVSALIAFGLTFVDATAYTWAWFFWFAFFGVIEGAAIIDRDPGDTLSEHIWKWFRIRDKPRSWHWRRWVLAGFLVWLLVHMVAGF